MYLLFSLAIHLYFSTVPAKMNSILVEGMGRFFGQADRTAVINCELVSLEKHHRIALNLQAQLIVAISTDAREGTAWKCKLPSLELHLGIFSDESSSSKNCASAHLLSR